VLQYWEPAKWVAKLRATKKGNDRLLFRTRMQAGHGGASGRYRRYEDQAFEGVQKSTASDDIHSVMSPRCTSKRS